MPEPGVRQKLNGEKSARCLYCQPEQPIHV